MLRFLRIFVIRFHPFRRARRRSGRRFALGIVFGSAVSLSPSGAVEAQTLYGVVTNNPNEGYLVSIDPATGTATLIGSTGITAPGGLAYNSNTGVLYVMDVFGGGQVYTIDPAMGTATALPQWGAISTASTLAYRSIDNLLYTNSPDVGTDVIYQLDPATGASVDFVGVVNKGPLGGLAVRPSDGVLFGTGRLGTQEWLVTISTVQGPPPLETDVGQTGRPIFGLAFASDGTLYGSDGDNLVTLNTSTGAVTDIGPFGSNVGLVTGLEFVTPGTPGPVDVWSRDCEAEVGNTVDFKFRTG